MKTLFVTATAQTEANYYLIWHLFKENNTDIKKIVIISTEFTRTKGYVDNLTSVLTALQVGSETSPVTIEELHLQNGIEENNVEAIKDVLLQWLAHNKASQIIFNITGGTKLMSIAQDQIAQISSRYDCVYQSRANNQLVWYNRPPNKQCYDLVLPENLEARLKARGYQAVSAETSFLDLPAQQYHYINQIYQYMKADFDKAQSLVLLLNALTAGLMKQPEHSFPQTVTVQDSNLLKKCITWLKLLAQAPQPYFSYDSLAGTITWEDKQAVEFVGGKWFEVLTGSGLFSTISHSSSKSMYRLAYSSKKPVMAMKSMWRISTQVTCICLNAKRLTGIGKTTLLPKSMPTYASLILSDKSAGSIHTSIL